MSRLEGSWLNRRAGWIAVGLAAVGVAQTLLSVCGDRRGPHWDESTNLAWGYICLTKGSFHQGNPVPPLVHMLEAAPMLFIPGVRLPDNWDLLGQIAVGDQFVNKNGADPATMIFWGRVPAALLYGALIWLVCRWAWELYGPVAGLLAGIFCATDPSLIGRAGFIGTDIGVTLFCLLAVRWFLLYLDAPGLKTAALAGLGLGLSLVSKFSAVFLLPAGVWLLGLWLWQQWRATQPKFAAAKGDQRRKLRREFRQSVLSRVSGLAWMLVVAACVIAATYRVTEVNNFWDGMRVQLGRATGTYINFMFGKFSETGWWYYYPVALLVKTPLPLLVCLLMALWRSTWKELRLMAAPATLFGLACRSGLQMGPRYILPIHPFLAIFASRVSQQGWMRHRVGMAFVGGLVVWQMAGNLRIFPAYPMFYNELVAVAYGSADRGYKILMDFDIGVNVAAIRNHIKERKVGQIMMVGYNWSLRRPYVVHADARAILSKEDQRDPRLALETGRMAAIVQPLAYAWRGAMKPEDRLDWLEERPPAAVLAHAMFAYDLTGRPKEMERLLAFQ